MQWSKYVGYAGLFAYVWARRSSQQKTQLLVMEAFRSSLRNGDSSKTDWRWHCSNESTYFQVTLLYQENLFYKATFQRETKKWLYASPYNHHLTSDEKNRLHLTMQRHLPKEPEKKLEPTVTTEAEKAAVKELKKGLRRIKQRQKDSLLTERGGDFCVQ